MTDADVALSRQVMSASRLRPRLGNCFVNAFRFLSEVKDQSGEAPRYVEGFIECPFARERIAHAWLETHDGRVVDVTLGWKATHADALARLTEHVPLRRFTIREVLDHLDVRGATLPILEAELRKGEVGE